MPKLTKNLIFEFDKTKESINKSKRKHKKVMDEILKIESIQTKLKEKYDGCPGRWTASSIEFCNDSYMDDTPTEYEWVEISEDEYYKKNSNWNSKDSENYKEDYIYEPEFKIIYYKKVEKSYKYLRVYVEETWRYGGYDYTHVDFLITDIMDEKDLRKEKLKKLM